MKTFQIDGKANHLYFTNYDREDEEALFQKIILKLKGSRRINIGEKRTGPTEDYFECRIDELPFILIYDINYGASIFTENDETMQKLQQFFGA